MAGWLERLLLGTPRTIAGTIYGTIVVLTALAAGAHGLRDDPWRLAIVVVVTAFVFWVAHVYSHGIGESIARQHRLDWKEFSEIARREFAILLAVVAPVTALVLGAIGVFRETTAIWLAVGAGVATLAAEGYRYARIEELGRFGTFVSVAVNLSFGLVIVALKVVVTH